MSRLQRTKRWFLSKLPSKFQMPVAPRYVGLFWMSIMCILTGVAYSPLSNIPGQLPLGLDIVTALLPSAVPGWDPIWVFGALWLLVGISGIYTILARRKGEVVFAGQVGMFLLWGVSFLASFVLGAPRGWVTAGIFLIFAAATNSFTRVDPPLRLLWRKLRRPKWTRS